ncbi:MAG: ATP-binding protein [Methanobrevibacter sp.]|jgi:hypothetical protein|nr:ATP-binding protein [Candidatus Methanovirga procula]
MKNNLNENSSKNKDVKQIRLGKQTLEFLIENNFLYVDKTKEVYNLINNESAVFLSRPRRFGKSLLVSTLKNLFSGNKELFKDLYIYNHWNWDKSYSVIHLDMSDLDSSSTEKLEIDLENTIEIIAKTNNIKLDEKISLRKKFSNLIMELYNTINKQVVVLIDEYDAPILNNIKNQDLADANRETLQNFYQTLKNSDEYLKFVFITGITKFIHTSIFSKLNNLTDISLLSDYSTICGITHKELNDYLGVHIQTFADKNNMVYDEALSKINYWYDGYSFDGKKKVFNPFSTLSALKNGKLSKYWFSTGTPHFLVDILKSKNYKFSKFPIGNNRKININFEDMELSESDLNEIDPLKIEDIPLLFQGGYLTVDKEFINENDENYYSLKIPNFEVEQAYENNLVDIYLNKVDEEFDILQDDMWNWIRNGDCEKLAKKMKIKLSRLPQAVRLSKENVEKWKLYSAVFLTWLDKMGVIFDGEKNIGHGVIDTIIEENDEHVAIVEIKYSEDSKKSLDSLINESFKQIHEKEYYLPYEDSDVSLLALAFKDRKIKNGIITDVKCKIEKWNY